ncbi:MAG: hypothetical protein ACI9H9_001347 [Pseudoalteromonas tetraodonis]|jgi:hypothetical protein|uniref:DUF2802 domain-containing protein n=5 Tax=Pseudoalteromonas TaxID=53246 RepID=A0A9W4VW29_PSEHA|nr:MULTISPECIES: DUF2802 domain-containing protein [Pseudoalteromonas]MAY59360.1 DUF2802 domain-containing protein [Pseudoalteromonas sp.]ALQ55449.1 hypothetical protein PI2015_2170 [Pseudoalteromonas issachenkonii]ATC91302.1 hypothetical protein PISS_a2493 [Pseudoalteromonas issachenkonii]KAF7765705.1 hypothetical protein PUND_a1423 [Pseudoalteromonas undina]KGJ98609.1 hypothetical protein ND6B_3148 [Pseudoalteromonas sp. ND6B]|tara:strand:- start:13685 stop:14086 length:402 start_codon:yes stop_codon:yes gene_type:complete
MLLLGIAIAGLVFGLFSLLLIVMFKKRYASELGAQLQQFKDSSEQINILRSEVSELRTGLLSIGKRVLEVEQQNQELIQQQAAQKYDDPDAKIYSRAVKMVELGADLDEVIRECELPRAEAELLFSLHKQKGA